MSAERYKVQFELGAPLARRRSALRPFCHFLSIDRGCLCRGFASTSSGLCADRPKKYYHEILDTIFKTVEKHDIKVKASQYHLRWFD